MQPLWAPSKGRVERSNMYRFMQTVNTKHDQSFTDYNELYQWSVDNLALFWQMMWDFIPLIASHQYETVLKNPDSMRDAVWFTGSRLNFAENLLRFRDDRTALVFRGEDRLRRAMSYKELYRTVARTASSLRNLGVSPGDRVVGFMPNRHETVIAMLAAASLGCLWSSCSPDFGIKGVLDRFGQIEPKVLFTGDGYFFKG
ncbi:MAG TPA: AMP-binding protein, partial [Desulfopila sp.]|nr:AMP-binding protein [Desulfopila sp.]